MNLQLNRGIRLGLSTIALFSITSLSSTPALATGSNSSLPVTVYKHVNFRGRSLSIGEGDTSYRTIRRSRVGNDNISSIRIEPGYEVLACEHGGLRGRCITFTNSTADLRDINFNDTISSIRVTKLPMPLPVTVYQHVNFRGNALSIGTGDVTIEDLKNSIVGNDTISSIRIADGYEVVACEYGQLRGRCDTYTNDVPDLRTLHFNDVISSLTVRLESTGNNNAPIAQDLTVSTDADTSIINFAVNATDPDMDPLTYTATAPTKGFLTNNFDGTFTFDPNGDFSELLTTETETVTFNYTVSDEIDEATATVNIIVTGTTEPFVNIAPVAQDGTFTISADDTADISLAALVTDANGDPLELELLTEPEKGVVTATNPGSFENVTFNPGFDFTLLPVGQTETVSFNYSVSDGFETDTGTITIVVEGTYEMTYAVGDTGPGGGTVFSLNNPVDGRSSSGLEYAPAYSDALITWDEAIAYANGFSTDAASNWFLPSDEQLLIIQAIPGVLTDTNGAAAGGNSWWTSTEDTDENAFVVNVLIGSEPATEDKANQHNALPVRSF